MKILPFLLFLTLFAWSCKSPEKLLQEGNYDEVIDKGIKKMLKDKADNEDKELVDKAYNLANQRDLDRIRFLKSEGKPENWEEIYQRYSALNYRQDQIKKVIPFTIGSRKVNYSLTDYTNSMVEAKTNAADYYYSKGKQQMAMNTKEGFREAYACFNKTRQYRASGYPDLDQLINDSRYKGTSRVLVELVNDAHVDLPRDFYSNVLSINTSELNTFWVEYHLARLDKNIQYDYFATIVMEMISVSPDNYSSREYGRKKTVEDGFQYVLDRKGNVMKDSLGNDIKVIKYKDYTCTIIERHQTKSATIKGQIEFVSTNPQRLIKKEPVSATSLFEHFSGRAIGDHEALLPEDMRLVQVEAVPFPSDLDMIYDCTETLRKAITDAIRGNRNLIY